MLCSVWNPLYMRADAAVKAMAQEYGVKEGDILDRDSDNLATRAALVETHVIKQTKEFLEKVLLGKLKCHPVAHCSLTFKMRRRGVTVVDCCCVVDRRALASAPSRQPCGAPKSTAAPLPCW